MKQKIIPIFFLALMCASCDDIVTEEDSRDFINFETSAIKTKGTLVNEFPEAGQYGVLGYCRVNGLGNSDWHIKRGQAIPDIFYNQRVTYTQAAGSVYTPMKSWSHDPSDKYTFFAYYPWQNQRSSTKTITLSPNTQTGAPMLTYKMAYTSTSDDTKILDPSSMIDVMVASDIDRTNSMGKSQFSFKHILTAFDFGVNNYKDGQPVTLRSVTMKGTFKRSVTVDMETMSYTVDPSLTYKGTFNILTTARTIQPNITSGMETINAPNGVLLMIPETLTGYNYWTITVKYGSPTVLTEYFYIEDIAFLPGIKNTICIDFMGDACTLRVVSGTSWDTPPEQDNNPSFE